MRRLALFSIASAGAGTSATLMADAPGCADPRVATSTTVESPKPNAQRRVITLFMISSLMSGPALLADTVARA
jgi:hypothetical protein